jgi:RNA polymerase sigma-70 factor (ECF subfamily)
MTPAKLPEFGANGSGTVSQVDDTALAMEARRGAQSAFDELYRRHSQRMFWVAHRITRSREDAEDAVQESFLSAYIHLKDFEGRATFLTWMSRIATNSALMKVRRARTSREVSTEEICETFDLTFTDRFVDPSPSAEQICSQHEERLVLKNAIAQLRPVLRRTVNCYLSCDSMDETAKALGISIVAAKGRLFHARLALRKIAKRRSHRTKLETTPRRCNLSARPKTLVSIASANSR